MSVSALLIQGVQLMLMGMGFVFVFLGILIAAVTLASRLLAGLSGASDIEFEATAEASTNGETMADPNWCR